MRALVIFLFVLGAVAFMARCGSEVTEVAWTNESADSLVVHQIVWLQDNVEWTDTTSGYAVGASTGTKEVTSTASNVECSYYDGGFNVTQITNIVGAEYFSGTSKNPTVRLYEGSTNNLRISAVK